MLVVVDWVVVVVVVVEPVVVLVLVVVDRVVLVVEVVVLVVEVVVLVAVDRVVLVDELAEDQRRVMVMRFAEEKSIREIANELGRSEGAVKQLQFRALENLRKDRKSVV